MASSEIHTTASRLAVFLRDVLLPSVHRDSAPLEMSAYTVRGEPIAFEQAQKAGYASFHVGELWGPPWSTTWFHVRGLVPERWRGQSVVAFFDPGFLDKTGFTCEALAWKEGRPWRGVDPNHRWLPIGGPEVDLYLEAAANPTAVLSGPEDAPSMIALRDSPSPVFTFRQAELRIQDRALRKVALDFKVLLELAEAQPEPGPREAEIIAALARFADRVDPGRVAESAVDAAG